MNVCITDGHGEAGFAVDAERRQDERDQLLMPGFTASLHFRALQSGKLWHPHLHAGSTERENGNALVKFDARRRIRVADFEHLRHTAACHMCICPWH
jgi:hypothetical protein